MAYKNADSQHLVDVLTDHIGLYHRTVKSASSNTAGASEESFRPRILDWMRRLSIEERQASLTVVDRPWVEILLQMQHHMRTNGESYFFLLPDIPTPAVPCKESRAMSSKPQKSKSVKKRAGNQTLDKMAPSPLLPSLCFRKAKGLLKRLSKQEVGNAMLYRNLRVYSSLDGENINGKPGCLPPLDTLCVSKDLLADLDQFVAAMDAITFGQFLSSPSLGKASSWEELPWLKEMGFYNSRAFVANKLEIMLWSAWMNSEGMKLGSKKIAVSLRKELGKKGRFPKGEMHNKTLAISVNRTPVVFANWWNKQDNDMKVNSLKYAVTAAAKIEAIQALSEPRVSSGTQRSYRSKLKGNSISKTVDEAHEFVSHSAHLSDSESEVLDLGDCSDSKYATLSHLTTGLKALKHLALSGFLPGTGEGQVWEQKSMDYLSHQSLGSAESLSCNAFRRVRHVLSRVMRSSIEIDLLGTENSPGHSTCAQMSGSDVKDKRNKCKNLSQSKMVPKSRDSQSKASQAVMFQPTSLKANLDVEPVEAAGEIQKRKKKHGKKKMKSGKGKCLNDNQADGSLPCHVNDGEGQTNNLSKCITSSGLDESKVSNNQVVEDSKAQLVKGMTLQTSCVQTSFDQSMFNVDDVASSSHKMDTQIATQTIIMTEGCDGMVDGQTALVENLQIAISAAENGESAKSMSDSIQEVAEIAGMLNETQQFNWESREKRLSDNIALIGKGEVLTISSVSAEQGLSSQMSDESFQFSLNEADNCEHANILQPQISPIIGQPSSYEWPGSVSAYVPAVISELKPTAIEKLHLDVGSNWQQHFQGSLVGLCSQQPAPPAIFSNKSHHSNAKFLDWPSFFQPGYNLTQTVGYPLSLREESTHILLSQACVPVLVGPENCDLSKVSDDIKMDDIVYEVSDYDDSNYFSRVSEEEGGDKHFGEGNHKHTSDYNQIFGGGVMYWNTADYTGTGYSRPPSLSSEDSSWARHEADIYVVLDGSTDDTGGYPTLPIAATSNMISTSPRMASYHANYEQGSKSSTSHTALTISANDYSGKISSSLASSKVEDEQNSSTIVVPPLNGREGFGNDSQSMPVLRPIVVCRDPNLSRQIPVSDFPRRLESRSPHIPRRRGEIPRWKRPPSPVLRCVPPPPPPPPPPPSPVGEFRKRRGWTTARSGSSSPRHWGLTGWPSKENSDNKELQVEIVNGEIVGKNGRTRSIASIPPVHPISGALLFERLMSIPSLTLEQEHPDAAIPMRSTILFKTKPALQSAILKLHKALHEDIELFYKQVAAENIIRKPFVNVAVKKVAHAMQVLWPRSRLKIFGSNATGLALPCSDVDLVVYLPPVRNLEPIKEAGILEGRNGIKETCLQHAARYLADQDWVKVDTLKTIENTAIPIIMLVARVPVHNGSLEGNTLVPHNIKQGCIEEGKSEPQAEYSSDIDDASIIAEESVGPWGGESDRELVRLDISFESPSHTGVRTSELVRELIGQFPAILPLAMVLKQFLMDRSLDHPYTGGLSSYCLVILITRFLQHQQHLGWPFQQSLGSLLMDFLHFFGCVFDPRQMGISIRAGGLYLSRNRGHSIDPLHIEDPLHPLNNVGRNCFRIHQCVKAFADAHACLEKVVMEASFESSHSPHRGGGRTISCFKVLSKILPSLAGF